MQSRNNIAPQAAMAGRGQFSPRRRVLVRVCDMAIRAIKGTYMAMQKLAAR